MKKKVMLVGIILMVCLSLTACKSSDYKKAVEFQEKAKYEEALNLYNTLGIDYKDAQERSVECQSFIDAINEFDTVSKKVDEMNVELDLKVTDADTLLKSTDVALDKSLRPALETAISNTKVARCDIPEKPNTLDVILKTTEKLNGVNYENILSELKMSYNALDKSIKQYALVNNPKEAYVIECLGKVDNITDISAVTEGNDPNGKLNKAGGYTVQVYFSSNLVDQRLVTGNTVIEKGTVCGGSVEVYSTPEDAVKRNDYLATYDGTIFASGSHIAIGTCLVRVSDKLTASQQKNMETNIVSTLVAIKE